MLSVVNARSSRRVRSPRRTRRKIEARIERIRRRRKIGPRAISWVVGLARSTVYALLRRLGLGHLRVLRAPRPRFVRYERPVPGDLGHIDTKRLPRIGAGGGHFAHGRSEAVRHRGIGFLYQHVLVDDRTRCYYRETLPSERAADTAAFLERALAHFAGLGVRFRELMSDNHLSYTRSADFRAILMREGIEHLTIPPNTPRLNGKVERRPALRSCCSSPSAAPSAAGGRKRPAFASPNSVYPAPSCSKLCTKSGPSIGPASCGRRPRMSRDTNRQTLAQRGSPSSVPTSRPLRRDAMCSSSSSSSRFQAELPRTCFVRTEPWPTVAGGSTPPKDVRQRSSSPTAWTTAFISKSGERALRLLFAPADDGMFRRERFRRLAGS